MEARKGSGGVRPSNDGSIRTTVDCRVLEEYCRVREEEYIVILKRDHRRGSESKGMERRGRVSKRVDGREVDGLKGREDNEGKTLQ
jgi:hypothetical protein